MARDLFKELDEIKNYLRATGLKINAILNSKTTKKPFSELTFAKHNTEEALNQIIWLVDNYPHLLSISYFTPPNQSGDE